jgi:hypothetical protein
LKDTSKTKKQLLLKNNYYVSFIPTYFGAKIDNSFLNSSYQPFTGAEGPVYNNPSFDILLNGGMDDLFEDYRITGGVRIAGRFKQ